MVSNIDTNFVKEGRGESINIARKIYCEESFDETFSSCKPTDDDQQTLFQKVTKSVLKPDCSVACFLYSIFPILNWLPKYEIKKNLFTDLTGGLTVLIMHVPQGLAYALLAALPTVTGLYTAVIPLVVYMVMGTSKHISLGTFAVVSLMVGQVVEREVAKLSLGITDSQIPGVNASSSLSGSLLDSQRESNVSISNEDAQRVAIAVSLSLLVGLIQLLLGVLRLGVVSVYLSDPLVSGFTTGAAILVFTSQIKHIFGIAVPRYTGVFSLIKGYVFLLKNIATSNVAAIITGVLAILLLLVSKYLDGKFKKFLKFPIPAELLLVILGTGISYGASLNRRFQLNIINDIPKGLPPITVPSLSSTVNILPDAFIIAIVSFAVNISIAKLFAKKHKYSIDASQELIACGASNLAGSFFSCFPVSASLSRSAVQESMAITQLCCIPVVIGMVLVLLYIAPLFAHLPTAILAATIIVALRGLFRQFSRLKVLWHIYKPDAIVWLGTWLGVVLLGIDIGLLVGLVLAIGMVLLRSSRPHRVLLGQISGTDIFKNITRCKSAKEVPGVKVFRYESSLFFANAENFANTLAELTGVDPSKINGKKESIAVKFEKMPSFHNLGVEGASPLHSSEEGQESVTFAKQSSASVSNGQIQPLHEVELDSLEDENENGSNDPVEVHTIVVDASTFNFIDSVGVTTLIRLAKEYGNAGVNFYLAHCSYSVLEMLDRGHFLKEVGSHHLFVNIEDAVVHAVNNRNTLVKQHLQEEETSCEGYLETGSVGILFDRQPSTGEDIDSHL